MSETQQCLSYASEAIAILTVSSKRKRVHHNFPTLLQDAECVPITVSERVIARASPTENTTMTSRSNSKAKRHPTASLQRYSFHDFLCQE